MRAGIGWDRRGCLLQSDAGLDCLLDCIGWYSVTPELIANQVTEWCSIVDVFFGVGGNEIVFAQTCVRVIDYMPVIPSIS